MTKAKKIFLIILSIIIVIALLYAAFVGVVWYVLPNIGLGGAGDWSFDKIPGNYEIWRINAEDIHLLSVDEDGKGANRDVVGPYISAFWHDDRYIVVKQYPGKKEGNYDVTDAVFSPKSYENGLEGDVENHQPAEKKKRQRQDLAGEGHA